MTKTESRTPARRNKRQNILALTAAVCLAIVSLSGSGNPPSGHQTAIEAELQSLSARGITYEFLPDSVVELHDPFSGTTFLRSLKSRNDDEVREWAHMRGLPILEINPTLVDTSSYAGRYKYWTSIPVSSGTGRPLVVGDTDRDGRAEVFSDSLSPGSELISCVYELSPDGSASLVHQYLPRPGLPRLITDVDGDHLAEVVFTFGGEARFFESSSITSLPTEEVFLHHTWTSGLSPGFTGIRFGRLDQDEATDFLYKGSEPDSANPQNGVGREYVAEYASLAGNFIRKWSTHFYETSEASVSGFVVEDFDGDRRMEFLATGGLLGHIFVVENVGNDSYELVWRDSLPLTNLFYQCSGDVDHDGKPEFFVGATQNNGNWIGVYETDYDNHYAARFLLHLISGGVLDSPTMTTADMDGDGYADLIVMSGQYLYFFSSHVDDQYELLFMKREDSKDAVTVCDVTDDNRNDFLVSKSLGGAHTDVYVATGPVSVGSDVSFRTRQSLQAFPNPFNSSTVVAFNLEARQHVDVTLYNVLGQEVSRVFHGIAVRGKNEVKVVWNSLPSGLFICVIQGESGIRLVGKLIVLR